MRRQLLLGLRVMCEKCIIYKGPRSSTVAYSQCYVGTVMREREGKRSLGRHHHRIPFRSWFHLADQRLVCCCGVKIGFLLLYICCIECFVCERRFKLLSTRHLTSFGKHSSQRSRISCIFRGRGLRMRRQVHLYGEAWTCLTLRCSDRLLVLHCLRLYVFMYDLLFVR